MIDRPSRSRRPPLEMPNPARMYDYFLGGSHNLEVDRQAAERAIALYPEFPLIMRANRAFLRRVVRYLVGQGIDQFLDLGSGIPTVGNVHEVAQAANPAARVLYVDMDPIAVAQSTALLSVNPLAAALQADIRQPELMLERAKAIGLLDFDRPLAVLLAFVLHFVTDDAVAEHIVQSMRGAVAPGSFLVITHSTGEGTREAHGDLIRLYQRSTNPVVSRPPSYLERWLDGLELIEPGIVPTPLWRPESDHDLYLDEPRRASGAAAVARMPGPVARPWAAGS